MNKTRGAIEKCPFNSNHRGVDWAEREKYIVRRHDGSDSVNNTQKTSLWAGVKGCCSYPLRSFRLAANYNRKLIHLVALITSRLCHKLADNALPSPSSAHYARFLKGGGDIDRKIATAVDFLCQDENERESSVVCRHEGTLNPKDRRDASWRTMNIPMSPPRSF